MAAKDLSFSRKLMVFIGIPFFGMHLVYFIRAVTDMTDLEYKNVWIGILVFSFAYFMSFYLTVARFKYMFPDNLISKGLKKQVYGNINHLMIQGALMFLVMLVLYLRKM
jgi:hypothetical protein